MIVAPTLYNVLELGRWMRSQPRPVRVWPSMAGVTPTQMTAAEAIAADLQNDAEKIPAETIRAYAGLEKEYENE